MGLSTSGASALAGCAGTGDEAESSGSADWTLPGRDAQMAAAKQTLAK